MILRSSRITFLFLFSLFLFCCNDGQNSVNLLKKAQSIIESYPSQAFTLLDSIQNPKEMKTDDYMQYIVTLVQAKYKTDRDITSDTIIFAAQHYFDKGSDPNKKALAHYYSAAVYDEKGVLDKSLVCYLSAKQYAKQSGNYLLLGRSLHNIGYTYYGEELMDSAIIHLRQAMDCYDKTDGAELNKLQLITLIGSAYKKSNGLDSAYLYFIKGLELADTLNNSEYQGLLMNNLGLVFRDKGEYEKSIDYFHQALKPTLVTEDSLKIYLNLSSVYNRTHQLDSANYYTTILKERLSDIKDKYALQSSYGSLCEHNEQTGNFEEAYYYSKLQRDVEKKITDADLANKIIEVEHVYQLNQKEKEVAAVQTRFYLLLIIGILLVSMITCISYFKAKNMRLKNQQEKEKNCLLQIQYDQKANSLIFLQNIYRKIASEWMAIDKEVDVLAEEYGATEKPTIYTRIKDVIENIRQITNLQLIDWTKDYLDKKPYAKSAIVHLNDTELLLVGLVYYNYSKADIAGILKISVNKIHPMKLTIKHKFKKAGLSEDQIDEILFSDISGLINT